MIQIHFFPREVVRGRNKKEIMGPLNNFVRPQSPGLFAFCSPIPAAAAAGTELMKRVKFNQFIQILIFEHNIREQLAATAAGSYRITAHKENFFSSALGRRFN